MTPRFCALCGAEYLPDASFCHSCGAPVGAVPVRGNAPPLNPALKWGLPAAAIVALIAISVFRVGASDPAAGVAPTVPLASGAMRTPDISAMSPVERADRLFNQVMRLWSDGKADSAAFFAPMALAAYEALEPRNAHLRYDMGLIALVSGDLRRAAGESAEILKERPSHLLGLSLAARVADARGDSTAARAARQKLLSAEQSERAAGLPEYDDHDSDLRAAIEVARSR